VLSFVHLWGNIMLYVISYYKMIGGNDQLTVAKAMIIVPIAICVDKIVAPIGASL
jgi:hypothetical protein